MMRGSMHRQGGLSLLELLVAIAILGMALGLLYRVSGGAARAAGLAEQQQQASVLLDSLLASREAIPEGGVQASGQSAGFDWSLRSEPFPTELAGDSRVTPLHQLSVVVSWSDGGVPRSIEAHTLLPQWKPPPGGRL